MTDRLSRFTPNAPGLDRDAIVFAAGRRAARASWLWLVAAAVLAVSQAATLVALWPHERPATAVIPAPPPAASPGPDLRLAPASPDPGLWSVGSRPDVLEGPVSGSAGEFVSTGPPLTAGSALRFE
jgi:hypothetical protein